MISLQNISKTFFANTANEVKALRGVDLTIPEKEFLILIGSNGSGKSTLLNAVSGSVDIDTGKIILDKYDITKLKDFARSKFVSRVFQNPLAGTAPDLTVLENFRLAALRTQSKNLKNGISKKFRTEVAEKIAMLGMNLETKLDQKMGALSGGQRQALTLQMAVMDSTKIILLDEPTSALDPRSSETLMMNADRLIKEFSLTAIMVTHNLKEAYRYGNRIIQMQEGKVLRDLNAEKKSTLALTDLYKWFE